MAQKSMGVWLASLGMVAGLAGNVLVFGRQIGLSVGLFAIIIMLLMAVAVRRSGTRIRVRNLWLAAAALFFAFMVAVRANSDLITLNVAMTVFLGALSLYYLPTRRAVDEERFRAYVAGAVDSTGGAMTLAGDEFREAAKWLGESGRRQDGESLGAALRGIAMAAPIIIIFALLLGSADAVFADYLGEVSGVLTFMNGPTVIGRVMFFVAVAWLATGALSYGVGRQRVWRTARALVVVPGIESARSAAENDPAPASKPKRAGFQLGIIESSIILLGLNILFGFFVLIQFAYFFGGQDNISLDGYTYAQYARRGFFELFTVSALTLGLALALDWSTIRRTRRQHTLFRAMSVVVVALMMVMIISASERMALYEDAFGFTHLRVYAHAAILWLGGLFVAFLMALFRFKRHIFSLGMLVVALGYLATLNVMNVDRYIAGKNIDRYLNGRQLDICYLRGLSVDAMPEMLELRDQVVQSDPVILSHVDSWLADQQDALSADGDRSIFSYHHARESARALLGQIDREARYADYRACYGVVRQRTDS